MEKYLMNTIFRPGDFVIVEKNYRQTYASTKKLVAKHGVVLKYKRSFGKMGREWITRIYYTIKFDDDSIRELLNEESGYETERINFDIPRMREKKLAKILQK